MLTVAIAYCSDCDDPIDAASEWGEQWSPQDGLLFVCENCLRFYPERPRREWGSETAFQASVIDLAEENRWRVYHVSNVKGRLINVTAAGFPDLVLARRGERRLLVAELKTDTSDISLTQERWLKVLRSIPGVDVHIWRPSDWARIRRILAAGKEGIDG